MLQNKYFAVISVDFCVSNDGTNLCEKLTLINYRYIRPSNLCNIVYLLIINFKYMIVF